jgi:hypothetical protein
MTHDEASRWVMSFGKYKGKTMAEIGATSEGLQYLVWLQHERRDYVNYVDEAVRDYLAGRPLGIQEVK